MSAGIQEGQVSEVTSVAQVLGFDEALNVVLSHAASVRPPEIERLPLLASAGRVLAEGVPADRDQPPFDRATRDGFAVRATEWSSGSPLLVVGGVRAGSVWTNPTPPTQSAVEIMTGAPLPAWADAVAMIEHAELAGEEVSAQKGRQLRSGENVVLRGCEARAGDPLLAPSLTIDPAHIALAATCGREMLAVYKRPQVAIVATGDELVELADIPQPHQIRNSNSYALAALIEAAGGEARRLPIALDTLDDLRDRIAQGRKSSLLLLSGGVSAGKYDLVEDVLAEMGAEFFFTGVRMQPGKPAVFGRLPANGAPHSDPTWFFGLPGNPVSTQVTFHCFVQPLLRALCGAAVAPPDFVQATLAEDVRGKTGLTRLLPAYLRNDLDQPEVRLVPWQGSGDLAANARANCYALLPDGRDLRAGDVITVLLR
jgi:molybdopterin molybdotransferase